MPKPPGKAPIVILRNRRSGKYHLAARIGKSLASHEEDNLDEVGTYLDQMDFLPDDTDPADLCRHCWPI
jgi:hypothetical protein